MASCLHFRTGNWRCGVEIGKMDAGHVYDDMDNQKGSHDSGVSIIHLNKQKASTGQWARLPENIDQDIR